MRLIRILGLLVSILGTVILGLWGFPVSRQAIQVNLGGGELTMTWLGFSFLVVGFALQLVAEVIDSLRAGRRC